MKLFKAVLSDELYLVISAVLVSWYFLVIFQPGHILIVNLIIKIPWYECLLCNFKHFKCATWQNGQTHFKNLAAFASVLDHFVVLLIKGIKTADKCCRNIM